MGKSKSKNKNPASTGAGKAGHAEEFKSGLGIGDDLIENPVLSEEESEIIRQYNEDRRLATKAGDDYDSSLPGRAPWKIGSKVPDEHKLPGY